MSKQANSRSGFVIKLSQETVQKLVEEDHQAKTIANASSLQKSEDTAVKENKGESSHSDVQDNVKTREVVNALPNTDLHINKIKTTLTTLSTLTNSKETHDANDISTTDSLESGCTSKKGNAENSERSAHLSIESNPSWGEYAPYITYEGEDAIYTDPSSRQKYLWSKTSNSWEPKSDSDKPDREYSYEDDTHIYTEADGSKYFWDVDKKAWIPKVDDDFLAHYQMSYGFIDNKTEDKNEAKQVQKKTEPAAVKRKNEPQWFEPSADTNTKVYVSNLPQETTEDEFVDLMQKCGLVERDPSTQKMKVKLYMDKEHDCFKGDALCTYIKIESVDLALKLIDGSDYKGNTIKVERAHFQLKGAYNPALKPKKKKKKELEKIKKMQQKLFDWRPEKIVGERSKHERVVIVKNLFHPTDFDNEVQLILDYQQDLREECSKSGEVRKVVIYDRHPEGVAQITMKEPEQADAVVELINGRWFGKRQITAEIWDGRTKYRIAETDADINQRIEKWDKFLDGKVEEDKDSGNKSSEDKTDASVAKKNNVITEDKNDGSTEHKVDASTEDKEDGSTEDKEDGSTDDKEDGSTEDKEDGSTEDKEDGSTDDKEDGSVDNIKRIQVQETIGVPDRKMECDKSE